MYDNKTIKNKIITVSQAIKIYKTKYQSLFKTKKELDNNFKLTQSDRS